MNQLEAAEIRPYFQPIISVQTQQIFGYESLGRQIVNGRAASLGPFFTSGSVSERDQIAADRMIREKAISHLSGVPSPPYLFLNIKPNWIYNCYILTGELLTLQMLKKHNIDGKRIVIEVTESEFKGDLEHLNAIIENYRTAGCMIAIDDVGAGFSGLDRVALIRPNILKIDLNILRKSRTHEGYLALLRSFSNICDQIGASLLVEGVETTDDVQLALSVGANYLQGYLFSKALPQFLPEHHFALQVREELERFRNIQNEEMDYFFRYRTIEPELVDIGSRFNGEYADDMLERIIQDLRPACMRMYVCNEAGDQISSNYEADEAGHWKKVPQPLNTNWSWRPYFNMNIYMLKHNNQQFFLSYAYKDINRSVSVRTVSYRIGNGNYLFMDIRL